MQKDSNHHRQSRFITRALRLGDIPALMELEKRQWTSEQAASADDFRSRIGQHPHLCGGAFRAETGELVASLFGRPTAAADWANPGDWSTSAQRSSSHKPDCLFGISLTSIEGGAALQLVAYFYLHAVKRGYRYAYLGSPMPGLSRHLGRSPQADVEAYARSLRGALPVDPQLRYYHGKGFREVVAVVDNYFPHEASRNYGAILRAKVPHMWLRPVFRLMPEAVLRSIAAIVPRFAIPEEPASGTPSQSVA